MESYYTCCNTYNRRSAMSHAVLLGCKVHAVRVTSLLHKNKAVMRMSAKESISNDDETRHCRLPKIDTFYDSLIVEGGERLTKSAGVSTVREH